MGEVVAEANRPLSFLDTNNSPALNAALRGRTPRNCQIALGEEVYCCSLTIPASFSMDPGLPRQWWRAAGPHCLQGRPAQVWALGMHIGSWFLYGRP